MSDNGNNFAWRQKPSRQFTAAQARDQTVLSQYVRKDRAYSFMKNIRGSPPYYQRTFYDLLAMIRQLGTPTWFFTLSAADLKWPDMIQTIAKQYGVHYTDDEVVACGQWLQCCCRSRLSPQSPCSKEQSLSSKEDSWHVSSLTILHLFLVLLTLPMHIGHLIIV